MASSKRTGLWRRRQSDGSDGSGGLGGWWAQWIQVHAYLIVGIGLVVAGAGLFFSALLYRNLRTDLEELLPETAQSVLDVRAAATRLGALNHLSVVIESPNAQANRKFQMDLSAGLRKLPKGLVARVQENILAERAFFDRNKALYMDLSDLKDIERYIEGRLRAEKLKKGNNPFSMGLVEEDEVGGTPTYDFESLERKYRGKTQGWDRFSDGYFQSATGYHAIVLVFLPGKVTDGQANQKLAAETRRIVTELDPKRYDPKMVVGYSGDVQNMLDEHEGLVEDLELSTVVVLVLVGVSLWFFFRTFAGVYALCAALFAGTFATFGLSYFLVGYLNANTAFLGSIVIGNGINFGIIYLARFLEERRKGASLGASLVCAQNATAQATLVAALAAGLAYGSLVLTDFRGFNQFGVIGCLGMLLCWFSTFSLLPALLVVLEGWGWLKAEKASSSRDSLSTGGFFGWLGDVVSQQWRSILGFATLASFVSAVLAMSLSKERTLESDFSKLRNQRSIDSGSVFWSQKVDAVFQRYLTPTGVLTQSEDQAELVARALRKRWKEQGDRPAFSEVTTIQDLVPKDQEAKISVIRHIQRLLTPSVLRHMSSKDRALVKRYLPSEEDGALVPLTAQDLPEGVRVPFQELDGSLGKMVHVYPVLRRADDWDGREVIRFAREVREAIAEAGVSAVIAGQAPLSADMIETIAKDGPKATAFAFLAVALLVMLVFRGQKSAWLIVGALLLGVLWLVGLMAGFQLKVNFLNFIALPITFGIGVDYAVNVVARYEQDRRQRGRGDLRAALRETGGAVALCSWTTIVGYGSLLVAGSRAFVSFGLLAVLGELTCIVVALVVVPAYWQWRSQKNWTVSGEGLKSAPAEKKA